MTFVSQRKPLKLSQQEQSKLKGILDSDASSRVKIRAQILLEYADKLSLNRISINCKVSRPLVARTIDKALTEGIQAALQEKSRSGRPHKILINGSSQPK